MMRAAWALSLLALAGCAGCTDNSLAEGAAVPLCATDLECPSPLVCFNGECRDPRAVSVVDIEVTPLAGSGYVSQQFIRKDTRGVAQVDLELERPHLLAGTVRRPADSAMDPVGGAKVLLDPATTDNSIPGLVRRRVLFADDEGRFQAAVTSGEYTVTVWPPETHKDPPAQFALNLAGSVERSFDLPRATDLQPIVGRLLMAPGGAPIVGARLQLFDPVSANRRAISRAADSSSDFDQHGKPLPAGTFELLAPPARVLSDLTQAKILVVPGPQNPFVPTMEFWAGAGNLANPLLRYTGTYQAPVSLYVKTMGGGVPLESALVRAEGTVLGTNNGLGEPGFFSAQSTSNAQGIVKLELLPGDYALSVSPPAASAFGVTMRQPVVVRESNDPVLTPLVVDCAPRSVWTAQVLDADGAPVGEVSVKAVRLAKELRAAPPARMFETRTDSVGRFTLQLDDGEWRVSLVPPPARRLPREPNIPICIPASALECGPRPLPAVVRLKRQQTIFGLVTGKSPSGEPAPLSGASVDVYERSADGLSSFLAGTALTDEHGRYEVVLKRVEER